MNNCVGCLYKRRVDGGNKCTNDISNYYGSYVEWNHGCECFVPINTCESCRYRNAPAEKEPCRSCIRSHDGYKTHR